MIQDDFYKAIEANSFFNRNEPRSSDSFPRPSKIAIQTFIDSDVELRRGDQVLEIGCFIGDLLAEYRKKGMLVHGIEPSQNACAFALRQFSIDIENVAFSQSQFFGFDPQHEDRFNLVILDDVLGWVDRRSILQSLAAIDWLVPKNGHILYVNFTLILPTRSQIIIIRVKTSVTTVTPTGIISFWWVRASMRW